MGKRYLAWKDKNTKKGMIPNKPGIYRFYDKNHKMIYVGHAARLRHRVQSYNQDDCYKEHPTKKPLRPDIRYIYYNTMPVKKAQRIERKAKRNGKFNVL